MKLGLTVNQNKDFTINKKPETIAINDFEINEKAKTIAIQVADRVVVATYTGTYVITPLPWAEQELRTKDRVLTDNVIVKEIPYYETHNEKGKTVIIGG